MTYNFLAHTSEERQAMLNSIGLTQIDQLFEDVPQSIRAKAQQVVSDQLPKDGLDEFSLQNDFANVASKNTGVSFVSFLGGGAYHRFIPSAVNTVASRSEFYTAYTPYQPEISQGTLQVTYEFQSMISELTGMDVANASVYDAGHAVAEAAFMAFRVNKRKQVWILDSVNPECLKVLEAYANANESFAVKVVSWEALQQEGQKNGSACPDIAAVIVQIPSYFGTMVDPVVLQALCKQTGALMIVAADPVSLGVLEAPGKYGADIVVGDIQPLGNNLNFGGPYGGYMATKKEHFRQLPGRIVGRTIDKSGKPCYTLTFQTREQHIRRDKATSNICTNQALNVLKSTVYLSLVGPVGLQIVAEQSAYLTQQLVESLCQLEGVKRIESNQPYLFEAGVLFPVPVNDILQALEAKGIVGGIPLGTDYPEYANGLLVCCTERNTPEQIATYVESVAQVLSQVSAGMLVRA